MAAAAEIQVGTARIHGIGGTITMTGAATFNADTAGLADEFKVDRLSSQNGDVIETMVGSQRVRKVTIKFVPTGATRIAAEAVVTTLVALAPLAVVTLGGFTVTAFNGTYNYVGGGGVELTREGYAVCGIQLEAHEVAATAGTFAALAVIAT